MGWVRPRNGKFQAGYTGPNGKPITETFRLSRDAKAWVNAGEDAKNRGLWTDPRRGKMSLSSFYADVYLPTQVGLSSGTLRCGRTSWKHIEAAFGRRPVGGIEQAEVQAFFNKLTVESGPSAASHCRVEFGKIMKCALVARYVGFNPCVGTKMTPIEDTEVVFMTPAQVADLAEAMRSTSPFYEALVWLGCYTGPRINELLALTWDDIDLVHRTVTITKSKTIAGRNRSIRIPKLIVAKLEAHLAETRSTLVFPAPRGRALHPNTFRDREWKKAVTACGFDPRPTPHDMRHTAVSLWISQGATDIEIAKWAGHTSAAFTKRRYGHLFPEHGDALSDRLDALIESRTSTPAALVRSINL